MSSTLPSEFTPSSMIQPTGLQEGVWGPGTYTDAEFTPLPQDCSRLLEYFARITPGFTEDAALLSKVRFHGGDLPILPGPIKAQALV